MRTDLGVLLMEDAEGKFKVQLFDHPDKAKEIFDQLSGTIGDPKSRATFVKVTWGEKETLSEVESVDLPRKRKEEPWGHRLGVGPIAKPNQETEEDSEGEDGR